ncbi:MAG: hypothetical protein RL139_1524 [Gemmatimonadota bacterium]|jgi:Prealbumin-like fold domain
MGHQSWWTSRARRVASALAFGAVAVVAACRDDATPARVTGVAATANAVSNAPNQQDWRQCENDKDPASACSWITGNLTGTHNLYSEGWYVPHALRIPGILDTSPDTLVMTYGFKKGGHHTFDFLGVWNASLPNANVCTDARYADFCTGPVNATTPPPMLAISASTPAGSLAAALVAAAQSCGPTFADSLATAVARAEATGPAIALRGIGLAAISIAGASLDGCGTDVEATIRIVMTPSAGATSALLLVGAHIARTKDWSGGGATQVPGSPYHLGLVSINGISTGSMDLQLQANAVVPTSRVTLIKRSVDGVGEFRFIRTGGGDANPIPAIFTMTTGTPGTASSGADTLVFEDVPIGTQVITEDLQGRWLLTELACVDPTGNSSTSLATRAITLVVDAGDDIVCTFTNTDAGEIRVVKMTIGGDSTFSFTPTGFGAGAFTLTTVGGTMDTTFSNIVPASAESGAYRLSEAALAGWDAGSWTCLLADGTTSAGDPATGIQVVDDQVTTCTITNTKRGALRVVKTAVGGDSTFSFTPIGFGSGSFGLTTVSGTADRTFAGLMPAVSDSGTYRLSEVALTGWAAGPWQCRRQDGTTSAGDPAIGITVAAGETTTCAITNTKQATIVVKKVMVGGTGTFGFTEDVTGSISTNNGTLTQSVVPGTYHATEDTMPGWDLTALTCDDTNSSGSLATRRATFEVAAGETVTCTFTNTKRGAIRVVKTAVGGDSTFSFSPTGFGGVFTLTTVSGTKDTTFSNVTPALAVSGTYRLAEDALAGWTAGMLACLRQDGTTSAGDPATGITVAAGETTTCAITNTKWGAIVAKKVMVGGTGTFGFTEDVTGSISTNNGTLTQAVAPGTYHVTEDTVAGWYLTGLACDATGSSGDLATRRATYVVAAGQTVTCTFTNTLVTGGPTRTLGFWAQHQDLVQAFIFGPSGTPPAGYTLAVPVSALLPASVTQCAAPADRFWQSAYYLGGLNANVARTSTGGRRSALDQARMQLMRQLLAAVLNSVAFGTIPSGAAAYPSAFAAYCGTDRTAMLTAATALDAFNQSGDLMPWTIGPQVPARNKIVTQAMLALWDALP